MFSILYSVMTTSITLSKKSSQLEAYFNPPIQLKSPCEIGLIYFTTYHSIPNVNETNNKFHYIKDKKLKTIVIPKGCYEIESLYHYIHQQISIGIFGNDQSSYTTIFELKSNINTLKSEIKCIYEIDFTQPNSIGKLLGFNTKLAANKLHSSSEILNITKHNLIRITTSISTGSYYNDKPSHAIYEFGINVHPSFKIVENPSTILYYPLTTQIIESITVKVVDENDSLIDFQNELITLQLHLKEIETNVSY